jgi:hypothetical protein
MRLVEAFRRTENVKDKPFREDSRHLLVFAYSLAMQVSSTVVYLVIFIG